MVQPLTQWRNSSLSQALALCEEVLTKALAVSELEALALSERRLRKFLVASAWDIAKKANKWLVSKMPDEGEDLTEKQVDKLTQKYISFWKDFPEDTSDEIEKVTNEGYLAGKKVMIERAFGVGDAVYEPILKNQPELSHLTRNPEFLASYLVESIRKAVKPPISPKKARQILAKIKPRFDLKDVRAAKELTRTQVFWVGEYFNKSLSKQISKVVKQIVIDEGLRAREAKDVLEETLTHYWDPKKPPKPITDFHIPSPPNMLPSEYWEAVAANAATVGRIQGSMRQLASMNVTTYTVVNPIDERTCFRYNTGVLMGDGSWKQIQDIQIGDRVITRKGRLRRVVGKFRKRAERWAKITLDDGSLFESTSDHLLAEVGGGWVEAGISHKAWVERIQTEDQFCLSGMRRKIQQTQKLDKAWQGFGLFKRLWEEISQKKKNKNNKDLQDLWEGFSGLSIQAQSNLLFGQMCQKGLERRKGREDLSTLQKDFQGLQMFRGQIQSLFRGLQEGGPTQRDSKRETYQDLSEMWEEIQDQTFGNQKEDLLFRDLLQTSSFQKVSDLRQGFSDNALRKRSEGSLFFWMLSEKSKAQFVGGGSCQISGRGGGQVFQRGPNGEEMGCGFPDWGDSGCGGRRDLLAQQGECQRERSEKNQISGIRGISGCQAPRGKSQKREILDQTFIESSSQVIDVKIIQDPDFAYDIEVEEDHSYVVDPGVVVHNCPVCSEMNGMVLNVNTSIESMDGLLGKSPEEIKRLHPWPPEKEQLAKIPEYKKEGDLKFIKDPKAQTKFQKEGRGYPSFHFRCRCSIDINTQIITQPVIVSPEIAEKVPPNLKPIVPIKIPRGKSFIPELDHPTAPVKYNENVLRKALLDEDKAGALKLKSQETVRKQFNSLLYEETGAIPVDAVEKRTKAGRISIRKKMDAGGKYIVSSGEIRVKKMFHDLAKEFMESIAKGKTPTKHQAWGFQTYVHEAIHGTSRTGLGTYRYIGKTIEEISTEVLTRHIMMKKYGYSWNDFLAYDDWINKFTRNLHRAMRETSKEVLGKTFKLSDDAARRMMIDSSIKMRNKIYKAGDLFSDHNKYGEAYMKLLDPTADDLEKIRKIAKSKGLPEEKVQEFVDKYKSKLREFYKAEFVKLKV